MRFSFRMMISGACKLHQTLQAVVPVNDTPVEVVQIRGRKTSTIERNQRDADLAESPGMTSRIIHSGRLPERLQGTDHLEPLRQLLTLGFAGRHLEILDEATKRRLPRLDLRAIRESTRHPFRHGSRQDHTLPPPARCSVSVSSWHSSSSESLGSITTYDSKYRIFSTSLRVRSSAVAIREGRLFQKPDMSHRRVASSICPMRSRRTLLWMTSTPHFSQTTPR